MAGFWYLISDFLQHASYEAPDEDEQHELEEYHSEGQLKKKKRGVKLTV